MGAPSVNMVGAAEFDVRPAAASDLASVLSLLTTAGLPTEGVEAGFGPSYATASRPAPNVPRIIGAAGVERYGDSGLLRSAVVDPAFRGMNVGQLLMRNRIEWARMQNIRQLFLLTTTAESFFPRFGFEKVDRVEVPEEVRASLEFCSVCPASATVMRLQL